MPKISELPLVADGAIDGAEDLPILKNGAAARAKVSQVLSPIQSQIAGFEQLAIDGRADRLATIDLLQTIVWSENTLLLSTGGTSAISNYRTSALQDVLPGDVLEISCGPNGTIYPNVNGYAANGAFVSVLYTGGVPVDANTGVRGRAYVTIPAGVFKIRMGTATATPVTFARLVSSFDFNFEDLVGNALAPAGNYNLLGAKLHRLSSGSTALANGTSTAGSGYVEVAVGDTILWHLNGRSGVGTIALFDASRTFLRWLRTDLELDYGLQGEYTFNSIDDADVAYVMAGTIDEVSGAYFYVESKAPLSRQIQDTRGYLDARTLKRALATLMPAGSPLPNIGSGPAPTVTFLGNTSYLAFKRLPPSEDYSSGFFAVRIRLDALPAGVTEAPFKWLTAPSIAGGYRFKAATLSVGDEAVIWCEYASSYNYLRTAVSGAEVTILDRAFVELAPDAFDAIADYQMPALIEEPRFFDSRFAIPERAFRSYESDKLRTRWHGKKGAYFGNSIQYMMWPYVAPIMGLDMTQITVNGGDATQILTDANLALVPEDAALVTLSFGTGNNPPNGGYVASGSIDSRDRTKSEGAINFAMDWLTANRPNAFVMFISPIYCGEPGRDNTLWYFALKELAEYWQVPYCDVWMNADISARNWSLLSYDNIHLTPEGIERQGSVVAAKLRSLSW